MSRATPQSLRPPRSTVERVTFASSPWTLLFGLLVVATLFLGCATQQPVQPVTLRQATPGTALIYFFRPNTDAVDAKDSPTLIVDDRPVAVLGFASYTAVTLHPGKHRMALVAGPSQSPNWNRTVEFEVKEGATYYVALWHQSQPKPTPGHMAMYGVAGELVFRALNQPTGDRVVRFEVVDRDVAEFAIAGLRLVPAAAGDARQPP